MNIKSFFSAERLRSLFSKEQFQFQRSPLAIPGLVLFGILVIVYILNPPPKMVRPKPLPKDSAQKNRIPQKKPTTVQRSVEPAKSAQPKHKVKTEKPVEQPAPEVVSNAERPVAEQPEESGLALSFLPSSSPRRLDPFSPLVKEKAQPKAKKQTGQRTHVQPPIRLPRPPPDIALPKPPPPPAQPAVSVTGVIMDEHPVVFLKVGDEDMALSEGEKRGNVKVVSIEGTQVVLKVEDSVKVLALPK